MDNTNNQNLNPMGGPAPVVPTTPVVEQPAGDMPGVTPTPAPTEPTVPEVPGSETPAAPVAEEPGATLTQTPPDGTKVGM